MKTEIVLILHNIRSVHNVGSIFRTADAAGVSQVLLSGYTPTPLDRFGRVRKDFVKVSLGAEAAVSWKYTKTLSTLLKKMKREGFTILAIEQDARSTHLFSYTSTNSKIALILGNEVRGISPAILNYADSILEIPMHGKKESLNVSVAAGIVLFTLINKSAQQDSNLRPSP